MSTVRLVSVEEAVAGSVLVGTGDATAAWRPAADTAFKGDPGPEGPQGPAGSVDTSNVGELQDVDTTGAQDGEALLFSGGTSLWVPGAVAPAGHNHDADYAVVAHNHDAAYSAIAHNHDGSYSPLGHNHDAAYAALVHGHDSDYADILRQAGGPRPAVCIHLDDGYSSAYTVARPACNERGQKFTLFVQTGTIGNSGFVTSAQIAELHADGHEIGAHGVTGNPMTSLTPAQRVAEYDDSKATLEAIIGAPVTSWAYPQGDRSLDTERELWLRFRAVWGASSLARFYPRRAPGGNPFTMMRALWSATTHDALLEQIRGLPGTPQLLNIYAHDPGGAGGGSNPSVAQFEELLDLVQSLGIDTVTSSEEYAPVGLVNGGFEQDLKGWLTVQSGGSASSVVDTPDTALTGTRSVKLTSTGDTSHAYVRQIVPVIPGRTYTLSGRARTALTSGAGGARFRIQDMDYTGGTSGQAVMQSALYAGAGWSRESVQRVIPQSVFLVGIDCLLINATGDAWFDHLHFGLDAMGSHG